MKNVLCFDIGGTSVKYATVNEEGIFNKGSFPTDQTNGKKVLEEMCQVVEERNHPEPLEGISISSPGFVDNKTGMIVSGNIIDGFNGLNIRKFFKDKYNLPVAIENDANCATLGEHYSGNAKGYENVAVVTIGTGIGGGLIINDKLYTGNSHMAGEFGFMFINGIHTEKPEDEILSGYASTSALSRACSKALGEEVNGLEIFNRAKAGDKICQKCISDWYDALAMGIYNIAYTVNPDLVLLGGGVSAQPQIVDEIVDRIHKLKPSFSVDLMDIMKIDRCKYLNDAGIAGAYANFMTSEDLI